MQLLISIVPLFINARKDKRLISIEQDLLKFFLCSERLGSISALRRLFRFLDTNLYNLNRGKIDLKHQ